MRDKMRVWNWIIHLPVGNEAPNTVVEGVHIVSGPRWQSRG